MILDIPEVLGDRLGPEGARALAARLTERMGVLETRLLRWAFAFWVGQFAVLLGILFAFFRG